jgi:uncharacterized glyoxalase superfamily protein PhnB
MTIRSMPLNIVIPVLYYPDVRAAVAWLCAAFSFSERLRAGTHRAQLAIDGDVVVIAAGRRPPDALAALLTHSVMIRVDDVDRHRGRAAASGAEIVGAPQTHAFGERQYSALDLIGRLWTFSQTVDDVDSCRWGGVES